MSDNPYDGYDKLDPWDDEEDGSGAFSFVEDEYNSMDQGVGDGFTYVGDPLNSTAAQPGHTEAMPATQVRSNFGQPVDYVEPETPRRGILRRKKKGGKKDAGNEPLPAGYYSQQQGYGAPQQAYGAPAAPAEKRTRRRRRGRRLGCLFPLILCVLLVVGAYWVVAHPIDERLAFTPAEQETVNGTLSWAIPGMPYNVLLLGSDAREDDTASRTDTMVLMRVDLIGGKLTMVSIPRDTKVNIEGYGTSKINAAYAYGGAGGSVKAVSKLTGMPVNHVAVIHFEELVGLIDYLGGVTVNVPVDVNDLEYSGLVMDSGMQTMDGETALAWARTRYGFEDGDYQRQEDQRILMTAIMNRILSLSPREMPRALEELADMVGTDMRCYNLVPLFIRFKLFSPKVYSCAIPTTSEYVDGVWYENVDQVKMQELLRVVNSGGDPSTVS